MIMNKREELIDFLQSELREGLDPIQYAHGLEQEVNGDLDAEVASQDTILARPISVRLAYLG